MSDYQASEPHLLTDEALLSRAKRGDAEAFGDLYDRYLGPLYRYVYYRVGEVREAEDLTEAIFLKVWQRLPQYRKAKASFRTWLYRVAHNHLVDHYRTLKVEEPLPEEIKLASEVIQPEDAVIAKQDSQELAHAIASLPPEFQEILSLRFISGMSHREAGKVLGKSEGAVRVLQFRAIKALREHFAARGVSHG